MQHTGSPHATHMRPILLVVPATATLPAQSLREQADRLGILVGGAVDPENFGQADYANAFAARLNMLEPENDTKFTIVHPAAGVYNLVPGDQVKVLLPASLAGSGNTGIQLEGDGRVSNVVQITIR